MSSDDIYEPVRDNMSDEDWLNASDDDELYSASSASLSGESTLSYVTIIPEEEPLHDDDEQTWTFVSPGRSEEERDRRDTGPQPFNGECAGIQADVPNFDHPADSFKWFIDDTLLQYLCNNTNAKAREFFGANLREKINGIFWRDIGPQQLYIFLALNFLMSQNHKANIKSYWSRHPIIGGPPIFCGKVMSRNKWMNIMKCLRFTHPNEVVAGGPQSRIDPF